MLLCALLMMILNFADQESIVALETKIFGSCKNTILFSMFITVYTYFALRFLFKGPAVWMNKFFYLFLSNVFGILTKSYITEIDKPGLFFHYFYSEF